MDPIFFSLLLRDAAALLRPEPVHVVLGHDPHTSPSQSPAPCVTALRALSDIHALFQSGSKQRASGHVAAKVLFYAAQVSRVPLQFAALLVHEIEERARSIGQEIGPGASLQTTRPESTSKARTSGKRDTVGEGRVLVTEME